MLLCTNFRNTKKWICFTFALFLLLNLTGCKCCYNGRSPQVIEFHEDCVIDYQDCFDDNESSDFEMRSQLTPEMFSPYQEEDPRLGPGDILHVRLFDEEDASAEEVIVAPDGWLYVSLLDGIPVSGKTLSEVREMLTKEFGKYFQDPKVTLVPKLIHERRFRVLGHVLNSGVFPIQQPMRLREAIAMAGGPILPSYRQEERYSSRISLVDYSNSFIVRGNQKLDIDFEKLLLSADPSHDIYVRGGDYIYIAPYEKKEIFILGAVEAPQRLPYYNGMTVVSALAYVSGWPTPNPYSPNLRAVLVMRGSLDCPKVVQIDLYKVLNGEARDLLLQPGDILYAQNKTTRFGRELVWLAIETFLRSFGFEAGEHFADRHILKTRVIEGGDN